MTILASRFDRRAIMKAAWVKARWQIACGVARLAALKVCLKDAWAEAKAPREVATQKSIARSLDRAASRAEMVGARPASSKQCWFLAGLILKAGEDGLDEILDTNSILTSREASSRIDTYLNG